MSWLARTSLRGRFLLVVLLGVVLPIGVVGFGIVRSSRDSGVQLVRARLVQELEGAAAAFGRRWSRNQSLLLNLAESRMVQELVLEPSGSSVSTDPAAREEVEELWRDVSEFAWLVEVLDPTGRAVLLLPDALGQPRSARPPPPGFLNYEVPARERFSGEVLGTLRVQFRTDALVDRGAAGGGITGSVLAVVDRRTGISLTSLPVDPELFNRERFMWGEEEWLSIGREVVDPPIRLIMAAPLGPVTAPLEEAARQGTMALLLVVVGTFVLATLFSHWLTRSLEGLSTAAGGLAAGDLNAQVEETGPPEVRETAAAFNAMSATLRQTLDHLSQKEALAAVGEFAASLAHEVRNPLTSVRMDIERCAGRLEADPVQARVLADRALVAIDRLNASVTGILRVSRIGGGVLGPVDLRLPLEAAVRAAAPRFKEQGCVLHFETPPAPIEVVGDLGSLEQLVLNLLLNAAEASQPEGRVWLVVEESEEEVAVTVRDEGPGIPPADKDRIFEPLVTSKREGTGLGLPIARRIARAHGSEIEVESQWGRGATFRFHLRR